MKIPFVLFLLASISFSIESQAKDISILTWNTFLVPHPFNATKQVERADLMAEKIKALNHDVVFFSGSIY